MAKIDTNLIEGYADMTPEQKLAALEGFEYEDNAVELERQKNALSKANSEAAEWKRKHNALLTDEQRKQQEQAEKWENMEKELAGLRKEKPLPVTKQSWLRRAMMKPLRTLLRRPWNPEIWLRFCQQPDVFGKIRPKSHCGQAEKNAQRRGWKPRRRNDQGGFPETRHQIPDGVYQEQS